LSAGCEQNGLEDRRILSIAKATHGRIRRRSVLESPRRSSLNTLMVRMDGLGAAKGRSPPRYIPPRPLVRRRATGPPTVRRSEEAGGRGGAVAGGEGATEGRRELLGRGPTGEGGPPGARGGAEDKFMPPVREGGALGPVPGCTPCPAPSSDVPKAAAICAAANKPLVSETYSTKKSSHSKKYKSLEHIRQSRSDGILSRYYSPAKQPGQAAAARGVRRRNRRCDTYLCGSSRIRGYPRGTGDEAPLWTAGTEKRRPLAAAGCSTPRAGSTHTGVWSVVTTTRQAGR